jgi:hypothetical protein
LPKNAEIGTDILYSVRLFYTSLEAPVTKDTHVGYVAILYNGKNIGTLPLYTAGEAERSGFVGTLMAIKSLTKSRMFLSGFLFFSASVVVWIAAEIVISRHRKHKWDKYFSMKMNPAPNSLNKRNNKH